jgi:formiminotetrahydrofolate cyclodeaminase
VQADVDTAVALAASAAQAAARLVEVNLSATRDDPRVGQARAAAEAAARTMRNVFPPS